MTYYPDPKRYQQIGNGDPYGYADCTAWSAAYGVDADREGTFRTTGTAVRAHSNEPVPQQRSPGLNLPQVDASVLEITHGKVDLDTRIGIDFDHFRSKVESGRYALLQVNRGVLVTTGYGGRSDFGGGHCGVVSYRSGSAVWFDPLLLNVQRISWNVLERAAGALVIGVGGVVAGYGRAFAGFTRDVTPDWKVVVPKGQTLTDFVVDSHNVITDRNRVTSPNGFSALCSGPYYIRRKDGEQIKVTKITSGKHDGWIVRWKWARQVN